MRAAGVGLTIAVLALAGCVSGGSSTSSLPPPSSATVTADTGGIQGTVTDDEFVPISRAQVGLLPKGIQTNTTADGSFSFSGVEPGTYSLIIGAIGYFEATQKVTVVVGEITKSTVFLTQIPVSEPPFDEIMKFSGSLTLSGGCNAGVEALPEGVEWMDFSVPVNESKADGTPLAATQIIIDLTSVDAPATIDVDMKFYDAKDKLIASGTTADPNEHIEYLKLLPPQEYRLHVILCLGADAHFNIKVAITYEQGETALFIRENGLPD